MKNEQILAERAKHLAKREKIKHTEEIFEVLIFKLAHETYAIETKYIREVYPLKEYTPLPGTPSFIFGLINVRRKILTVIDLKSLFSLPSEPKDHYEVIILHDKEKEFGILCDSYENIQQIPINKTQTSLPTLTGIRQELLLGVTLEKVAILDGSKLLSNKNIIVNERVEL